MKYAFKFTKFLFFVLLTMLFLSYNASMPAAQEITISNEINFAFFSSGESVLKLFTVSNSGDSYTTVSKCDFDNPLFSLESCLPISIAAGGSKTLKAVIHPSNTAVYQTGCQLEYGANGVADGIVRSGLFFDNESELAETAHKALDAYNKAKLLDPASIASQNNLGVLYILLGQPDTADVILKETLSKALNSRYGYSGVQMNIGVAKSDENKTDDADNYYGYALNSIGDPNTTSALAPQIYFNKAWEAYQNANYADVEVFANQTINHEQTNDVLKTKAYTLLGARYFKLNLYEDAFSSFEKAMALDTEGAVGQLAEDNKILIQPIINVSPSDYDFGSVDVSGKIMQTFTITNNGLLDLKLDTITIAGQNASEFVLQNDNCSGQTLTPSESQTFEIVFSPSSEGNKSAEITISSNDEESPVIALAGSGESSVQDPWYQVTDDLSIRSVIKSVEKGDINAVWKQGGSATTADGHKVIWGHFYASPDDVTWGDPENPDLFVKIWFDAGGRIDVNFFHVSAPPIKVYSTYKGSLQEGTTTTDHRYIRQSYENGGSFSVFQDEDGIPIEGKIPSGNPVGVPTINSLRIGAIIQINENEAIEAGWQLGGSSTTARGDEVVWGHFYADPKDVSWGSPQNPDLFVKIWFDVGGSVYVNFFHVSVPDIEVYSSLPDDGSYDNKGTTVLEDRYIRHEYSR